MKSRHFSREAQKRPFLPPIQKSGSYPTYAHKSDYGATWSECGDTAQILSAKEKSGGGDKNLPFWEGQHRIRQSAERLLVGENPEPPLKNRTKKGA